MAAKNLVLLILSLTFYAWGEPVMVLVMLGSIGFNWLAAKTIDGQVGPGRLLALWAAICVNLLALAVFKYADFLAGALEAVLRVLGGPHLGMKRGQIALPLGISFFTFHALSYLVDVYRGRFPANRSLRQLALYIAFFPQLIAGPIVRYKRIARRLAFRRHSWGRASAGLRLVVIGLAMKVLVADPLAPLADAVFDHAPKLGQVGPTLAAAWIGTLAYTLQIYFDFAGYSTMAVGLGVVFGFSLPRNFDRPYRSRSITEFWRRWHITLSAWFRDYLYIPLGGNRLGPAKTYRNLLMVFLLCGLWHGASWTFVLWGLWHGLFLVIERAGLGRVLKHVPAPLAWAYALLVVMIGWVLFRAPSLEGAVQVWRGMAGLNGAGHGVGPELAPILTPGLPALMAIGLFLSIFGLKWARRLWPTRAPALAGGLLDGAAVCALLALSILSVAGGGYSPFLYYRF